MKRYLVRTTSRQWAEVNEYVFSVRKYVVDEETDEPLYEDQYIIVDGDEFTFHGTIDKVELGKLCRYFGASIPTGTYEFITEPEKVKIIKGNSIRLYILKTGDFWTKAPKSKAA